MKAIKVPGKTVADGGNFESVYVSHGNLFDMEGIYRPKPENEKYVVDRKLYRVWFE